MSSLQKLLKRKRLIGVTHLDFQRFSPLASCWLARQCAGRCSDSIGVDESPLSCRQQEAD